MFLKSIFIFYMAWIIQLGSETFKANHIRNQSVWSIKLKWLQYQWLKFHNQWLQADYYSNWLTFLILIMMHCWSRRVHDDSSTLTSLNILHRVFNGLGEQAEVSPDNDRYWTTDKIAQYEQATVIYDFNSDNTNLVYQNLNQ